MKQKGLNFELQGRVRKYLEYIMHKDINSEKEGKILNKLTNALKKEVILAFNGKVLDEIPLFRDNFSAQTIEELAFCLRQVRYSPEEFIFHVIYMKNFNLYVNFLREMIKTTLLYILLRRENLNMFLRL